MIDPLKCITTSRSAVCPKMFISPIAFSFSIASSFIVSRALVMDSETYRIRSRSVSCSRTFSLIAFFGSVSTE